MIALAVSLAALLVALGAVLIFCSMLLRRPGAEQQSRATVQRQRALHAENARLWKLTHDLYGVLSNEPDVPVAKQACELIAAAVGELNPEDRMAGDTVSDQ